MKTLLAVIMTIGILIGTTSIVNASECTIECKVLQIEVEDVSNVEKVFVRFWRISNSSARPRYLDPTTAKSMLATILTGVSLGLDFEVTMDCNDSEVDVSSVNLLVADDPT
jgi:hypothetical protein